MLCLGGGVGTWYYFNNLPQTYKVTYDVRAPYFSDYSINPISIQPLTISFYNSAAPVEQINKVVKQGITIVPPIAGEWYWANDRVLVFTPNEDWAINQKYDVKFAKKGLFSETVLLNKYDTSFETLPFTIKNVNARLYEDPAAAEQKQIVATIQFTHPVEQENFASFISFQLSKGLSFKDNGTANKPQIFFSDNGVEAYIHSNYLNMPLEQSTASMIVNKGIKAKAASNATSETIIKPVSVPGRYQLSFQQADIAFVDDKDGKPEPVLIFESSSAISDDEIADKVIAWQLPERENGKHWSNSDITENVLKNSKQVTLSLIPSSSGQSTLHSFRFKAEPQHHIYVKIKSNVESVNGYLSRNAQSLYSQLMPNYPKRLKFLSEGALLNINGEHKIGITAQGIFDAKVEIARILPQQLNQLVSQLNGDFKYPQMSVVDFDKLIERQDFQVPLAKVKPEVTQFSNINLSPYLDYENGRKGIFVLRLSSDENDGSYDNSYYSGDDERLNYTNNTKDIRFIVVTDLGIIAKRSQDGSHKIFVQSISHGVPVTNAKVEILGVNGLPVMTSYTDDWGYAEFKDTSTLNREKQPLMYLVTKDNDQSFLPIASYSRKLDYSRFDVDGVSSDESANSLHAFMFTDRGLYRPGDLAHIGFIIRANGWKGDLTGLPVEFSIKDPRGETIRVENINLSREAFENFDFQTNPNAPAGSYTASLYLPNNVRENESRFLGSVEFNVRDFEPDRMKVTASLTDKPIKGWIKPEDVTAQITAMQLFGAPASDRRATLDMRISPAFASFKNWSDYRFYSNNTVAEAITDSTNDETTDENGQANFDLNLNRFTARAYNLQIIAKVFEAGSGRNVTAEANGLVSSADMMLGVKSTDDLSYINKDSVRNVTWLAIQQDLNAIAVPNLTRETYQTDYVSVLLKQNDGSYRYQSQRRNKLINTQSISIEENGTIDRLDTSEPGKFFINIKKGDEILNQIFYEVAGDANTSRNLERNSELQLTLDKKSYAPDEEIAISIKAPYTGAGLITIERDNIYAFKWFNAYTTNSVQYIRLPRGIEGNAYINVQFVRSPSSEQIYMSPLSYGVAPFSINLDERNIETSLETPATSTPNSIIPIKVKLNQPARVVVYAVDEGILQVARYKQPKPLDYFFKKRALNVTTSQILDLILPEFSQIVAAAGGDGIEDSPPSHLNPFKRKAKPAVAWWSGILSLPAGETNLQWQSPDGYNGSLHFFAIAVNEQHIGISQTTTNVSSPVVITPNLSTFATPGDMMQVTAGIYNNLPEKSVIEVSLQLDNGLTLADTQPLKFELDPKREDTANFSVKIGNVLGSHALKFIAHLPDGEIISQTETISVRPAVERRVTIATELFHDAKKEVTPQRKLYSEYRSVEFGASGSPLVWGQALAQYLDNYSYICTEQTVSKAMPYIVMGDASNEESILAFKNAIDTLNTRQNSAGGYGMWNATPDSDIFMSLYAIDFLMDAQERGYVVPTYLWNGSIHYITSVSNTTVSGLKSLRYRAYAIYLLTRTGKVTSNELSALSQQLSEYFEPYQYEDDLISLYMAASYKMMKQDKQAAEIFNKQKWALLTQNYTSDDHYFNGLNHDAIMLNLFVRYAPEKLNQITDELFVKFGTILRYQNYNSLSAALLIRAFDNYDRALPQNMQVNITAMTNTGEQTPIMMTGRPQRAKIASNIKNLILEKQQSKSAAFYFLSEAGYDLALPEKPISNGIEIYHEYVSLDGKEIDHVTVGDEFLVKIRFRAMGVSNYESLALVDLLPGGTELVYAPQEDNNEENDNSDEYTDYYDGDGGYDEVSQFPIGETELSDWVPNFIDPRDDRVVLYGDFDGDSISTFTYRLRAVSAGDYVTPPAHIELMYLPEYNGLSAAGTLKILEVGKSYDKQAE